MPRTPAVGAMVLVVAGTLAGACGARAADRTPAPPRQPTPAAQEPPPDGVNPEAHAQKVFVDRVREYVKLRAQIEQTLPRLPEKAEPEQIDRHKKTLRDGVRQARKDARPGDMFQPDTAALIKKQLAAASRAKGQAPREAIEDAIKDDDPGQRRVSINGEYPEGQPVSTVPPQVLLALPRLPDEELEYRFMGRRLVLLDTRARMVIDYMDNALP